MIVPFGRGSAGAFLTAPWSRSLPFPDDPSLSDPDGACRPRCGGAEGAVRRAMLVVLAGLLVVAQVQLHLQPQHAQRSEAERWAAPACFAGVAAGARSSGGQGRLRGAQGHSFAAELPEGRSAGTRGAADAGTDGGGAPKAFAGFPVSLTLGDVIGDGGRRAAAPPRNDRLRSECARRGMRTSGRHPPM